VSEWATEKCLISVIRVGDDNDIIMKVIMIPIHDVNKR
jgi:hypothetical protein